jgi:signal transduction histidine kinase
VSRILIANHQEESCRRIVTALQRDHDIQVATDGWKAIELIYDKTPDTVIASLQMPGVNGLGLLAAARDSDPDLPVVLTTRTDLDSAVEIVRFGAWDVLVEPFDPDTVRTTIERALDAHALNEENQRLVEDLRRSNEFKGHLLRMMSHDLLNLLTAVKGFAWLARASDDLDRAHRYVDQIQGALGPIEQMADDFGTYGLIDAHALQLEVECVPLGDIIDTAVRTLLIDPRRHTLVLPEDPPSVRADRYRTSQVFMNLLGNALKYSPRGGEIRVEVERAGGEVVCRVSDHGMGIPQDKLASLFEPFYRLERDRSAGTPGRGLGLTIVKSLVEMQGGRIGVESRVGRGTTFWFTLPCEGC